MDNPFRARPLSRSRVIAALLVAMAADGIQLAATPAGPAAWFFFDQAVDVVAGIIECFLLGFHPLLLPTFVVELIPGVDMLPTWTGCVAGVILLRKRQLRKFPPRIVVSPPIQSDSSSKVIDV